MIRRTWPLFATAALVTVWSGIGHASPPTSATIASSVPVTETASGASTTSAPAATSASTTPAPAAAVVPAGMQYGDPVTLPIAPDAFVIDGGTWLLVGTTPSGEQSCRINEPTDCNDLLDPIAMIGTPEGGFEEARIDRTSTYVPPPQFEQLSSMRPSSAVKGAGGWVVAGNIQTIDPGATLTYTERSLLWFSADALTWQRIDLRDVLGPEAAVTIEQVIATDTGFVAVGSQDIFAFDATDHSRGIVLTSPDGVTWAKVADLSTPHESRGVGLHEVGGALVAYGYEYLCPNTATNFAGMAGGSDWRLVMWSSTDGGQTWSPIDSTATGVLADTAGAPADPSACPEIPVAGTYDARAAFVDGAGDHLVVSSADGARLATTSDFVTWNVADLPGGASDAAGLRRLTADGDDLVLIGPDHPMYPPPNDEQHYPIGRQHFGWRSADGGHTWQPLERAAPATDDELPQPYPQPDGSVVALDGDVVSLSTAGPLAADPGCQLVPAGRCVFTRVEESDLAGAALAGIDLTAAVLVETDLSGADLSGAILREAFMSSVVMTGANLTGANLDGATISGEWQTVNLTNANLERTWFEVVDLTGATLTGANLGHPAGDGAADTSARFYGELTCPDGQPRAAVEELDPSTCRLPA